MPVWDSRGARSTGCDDIETTKLSVDGSKTKAFAERIARIGVEGKALVVDSMENTNAVLATRNNPKVNFVDAGDVNVYDVVNSRYIVLSQDALHRLTETLES